MLPTHEGRPSSLMAGATEQVSIMRGTVSQEEHDEPELQRTGWQARRSAFRQMLRR